jgi:hypothetical protein
MGERLSPGELAELRRALDTDTIFRYEREGIANAVLLTEPTRELLRMLLATVAPGQSGLRAALEKYGRHLSGCHWLGGPFADCSACTPEAGPVRHCQCGLDAALADHSRGATEMVEPTSDGIRPDRAAEATEG